jgi:hypothetical protein
MVQKIWLGALAACMLSAQTPQAAEFTKVNPMAPVPPSVPASSTQSTSTEDPYMVCAFYPKPGTCEPVYKRAMKDQSISAQAVRAEYTGYARYLHGTTSLTDADRQYLKNSAIIMPPGLSAANQAGLHNVINDTSLSPDARRAAVNNFLSRAVQAELYCSFNDCKPDHVGKAAPDGAGV